MSAKKNAEDEVTPEMVAAGLAVLYASGVVEGRLGSDGLLVAKIYREMVAHSATQVAEAA